MRQRVASALCCRSMHLLVAAIVHAAENATETDSSSLESPGGWDRFFPAYTALTVSALTCAAAVIIQQTASRMPVTKEESI